MKDKKDELYDRIKKLEDWQIHLIIGDFLFDADEKQLKNIEKEVVDYERINKEVEKELKAKK